jgi:haloacid dehalogenase superfamily, subfamily IA, variant 3 with third motif having DD or ED
MKFLFDLGGVFFDWNPKYFYKDIFNDPKEMDFFLNDVCNDNWNLKQDAGRSIKEAEQIIISEFPKYEEQIRMYYANHRKMIRGTFKSSIKTLEKLKSLDIQCYVLSNWSAETFKGMTEEYSFLKLFDGILISGEEKLTKPDLAIYKLAIKRFNLVPEKSVFIDDKLANIKTAKKLGLNTIHLTNPKYNL